MFFTKFKWSGSSFVIGLIAGIALLRLSEIRKSWTEAAESGALKNLTAATLKTMLVSNTYRFGNFVAVENGGANNEIITLISPVASKGLIITVVRDKSTGCVTNCSISDTYNNNVSVGFQNSEKETDLILRRKIDGKNLFAIDHGLNGVFKFKDFDGNLVLLVDRQLMEGANVNGKIVVQKGNNSYDVKTKDGEYTIGNVH